MGALQRSTIVHSRPRREAQLPLFLYRSVHLPSRLVKAQLSYSLTVGPGRRPATLTSMHACVCSTVVLGFHKLTKIQKYFHEELLHYAALVNIVKNFKSAAIL